MMVDAWLQALEARHLADLTRPEVTRALRALSSCYVERRAKLAAGAALEGTGKRAAFALFYGPIHFLTVREIVHLLGAHEHAPTHILDLGCGTGASGAAWASQCAPSPTVAGVDRSAWAVQEATWTYRQFGLQGRAATGDLTRARLPSTRNSSVLLGFAVNELSDDRRAALLERLIDSVRGGSQLLIVEPIARRLNEWWDAWAARLGAHGARSDEWRFSVPLPSGVRNFARAAGLDPRQLTARTLSVLRPWS